jgi:recombination protein RecA
VNRKGAWYSYNGENISQGRDNLIKALEEKPDFARQIEQEVRQKLEMGAMVSATAVGVEAEEDEDEDYLEEE